MSMLYVVVLTYIEPLREVDDTIPAHVERLKKGYADDLPFVPGRRLPRTGRVILAKYASREILESRLGRGPFQQLGLARTKITPFKANMAPPVLQSLS